MSEKGEKTIAVMVLAISAVSLFSMGYNIGYYEGVKDTTEEVITMFKEVNEQLANITSPQNIVSDPWWNASWELRRRINSETNEYLYYSANCSEKQINEFIRGDYYKGNHYAYTFYDDFSGCCIRIVEEKGRDERGGEA